MSRRMVRINELIKRELAEMLYRVVNDRNFDIGAVTITHVITSSDLRNARVLVSIRGHETERPAMLRRLARHRAEFQQLLNEHLTLKFVPHLTFELDESLEQGDRVLSLIARLEAEQAPPPRQHEELDETPPATP